MKHTAVAQASSWRLARASTHATRRPSRVRLKRRRTYYYLLSAQHHTNCGHLAMLERLLYSCCTLSLCLVFLPCFFCGATYLQHCTMLLAHSCESDERKKATPLCAVLLYHSTISACLAHTYMFAALPNTHLLHNTWVAVVVMMAMAAARLAARVADVEWWWRMWCPWW